VITPATSGPMTLAEKLVFADDAGELGERCAAWLLSESRGWSALYDLNYWADVRQHAVSHKDPESWAA
jgi:hypothetical protein